MMRRALTTIALRSISVASTFLDRTTPSKSLNLLRASGYRMRNGIPRELNVPRGSKVVQVGMWRVPNAIRLAKAIGPSGRGLIVEASAEHAAAIRAEFERRGYDYMVVVNAAGWYENSTLTIRESDEPSGNQVDDVELDVPKKFTGATYEVAGRRVDDLAREHGLIPADYAEITVNGAEMDVLAGMPELLASLDRILVAGMMRDKDGVAANSVVEPFLQSEGFETQISRSGYEVSADWGKVDGHVFGYRR